VVDVAELDDAGRIERLTIVYDTAPIRGAFDRQRPDVDQDEATAGA
jgi:steroid delta-isomerase